MDAFQTYFVDILKYHYADFEGRARRKEYWMFYLFTVLGYLALSVLMTLASGVSETLGTVFGVLLFVLILGVVVPSIAVLVRRLHDTGRSGWWYLLSLIPLLGGLVVLYFLIQEGDAGPNEYGPDPKDPYPSGTGIDKFSGVLDR